MKIFASNNKTFQPDTFKNKNGSLFDIYTVTGNHYSIRDSLKKLGFRYWRPTNIWYIYKNQYNPQIIPSLNALGVDTSAVTGQAMTKPPQTPQTPQTPQEPSMPIGSPSMSKIDSMSTDNPKRSQWYKYPIKNNIYQDSFEHVDKETGKKMDMTIKVHRSFVPGKQSDEYNVKNARDYVGQPKYYFEVGNIENFEDKKKFNDFSDNPIKANRSSDSIITFSKRNKEKWGNYNEEEFINKIIQDIKRFFEQDKGQTLIKKEFVARERSDELINAIKNRDYKEFQSKLTFPDPRYNGIFKFRAKFNNWSDRHSSWATKMDLALELDHPFFNRFDKGTSYEIDISNVRTIEELENKIQETLNSDKLRGQLFTYLQSFPYLQEDYADKQEELKPILDIILNPEDNYYAVLQELRNREYIRYNRRQKSKEGLAKDDQIKWVVDSKKVINDTYSRDTCDVFTAIAYTVHRVVRGTGSTYSMMVRSAIGEVHRDLKKLYPELTAKEVLNAIETIATLIVTNFFEGGKKSRWEKYQEYYGSNKTGYEGMQEFESTLNSLYEFGKEYGVVPEEVQSSPKSVFRFLSKKVHPDTSTNEDEKIEKEKKFKELINIWDKIPKQLKVSFNYKNWTIIG